MGIIYKVVYHEQVVKQDIPALSKEWRNKIKNAIEDKLATRPEVFGKPLRNSLKDYRKLRVGDYRVIFRIESKMIKIFLIGNRTKVYVEAGKRKELRSLRDLR